MLNTVILMRLRLCFFAIILYILDVDGDAAIKCNTECQFLAFLLSIGVIIAVGGYVLQKLRPHTGHLEGVNLGH
jgi:hypothetical protein